jgi:thiamine biosynthesis lipoprotein
MRSRAAHATLGIFLCLNLIACQDFVPATRIERTVFLMGTIAKFAIEGSDRSLGLKHLDQMIRVIEETETELSTWRDDSVLGVFNRQPLNVWLNVPETVCSELNDVEIWYRATDGAFDPAIGSLIEAWGIRKAGQLPSADVLNKAKRHSGFRHVAFDRESCTVSRLAEVTLDAGAFGKGAALDRVGQHYQAESEGVFIDFGGQVAVFGKPLESGWPVSIAHPRDRELPVFELRLTEGSLAVSGGSEQDKWIADKRVSHILDPRTGEPVNRSLSVAVWHELALAADVIATALYVMGVEDGRAWAESHNVAACFLVPRGSTFLPLGDNIDFVTTTSFRKRFF